MKHYTPRQIMGLGWASIAIILLINVTDINKFQKFVSIRSDVLEYYAYLPAVFIYNDIGFGYAAKNPKVWNTKVWCLQSPTGKTMGRMSLGMAIAYSPFFLLAHGYTHLAGYETDGYSLPYHISIILAGLFYMLAGLYLLGNFLLRFFHSLVVVITLALLAFGTNLYFITTHQTGMPHVTVFGLMAAFVYFTAKFFDKPKLGYSLVLGFLFGLISLIRPTGAVLVFFFLLYKVGSLQNLKNNFNYFITNWLAILLVLIMVVVVWVPQLLYWRTFAGTWLYFSYGIKGEQFFFSNPQIINQLFSYRNGWLIYTPMVALMFIGFVPTFKTLRGLAVPIILVLILSVFVLSSWWCWWFVSFGNRAYIEFYSILAIPLAMLVQVIWQANTIYRIPISLIIVFLLGLNLLQTKKFEKEVIHFDSMTREAYWHSYNIFKPDTKYYQSLVKPNYQWAKKGVYFKHDHSNFIDYEGYEADKKLKDSLLFDIMSKMKSSPKTLEMLQTKADKRGISLDEMLIIDANWIFRNKYNLPKKPVPVPTNPAPKQ